jgi:NAD(P)-dependent dehydrogenase (short-subunit alcohol dehydrogenase family)
MTMTPGNALKGRSIVITGGSRGLGAAIAQVLGAEGATVVLADLVLQRAQEQAAALARQGIEALAEPLDVGEESQVLELMQRVHDRFGRLDAVINNAGIASPQNGPVGRLTLAQWNRRIATNLTSVFLTTKHAAAHLRRARGAIVNIASTRAVQSEPDTEAYAAAKGGMVALTHALAISLGPDVRVNCVSPGWIDTGKSKLRRIDHEQHPAGRVGRVQDIAEMVSFLLSERAGFTTRAHIIVDGGMTRKMIYAQLESGVRALFPATHCFGK